MLLFLFLTPDVLTLYSVVERLVSIDVLLICLCFFVLCFFVLLRQ